MHMNLHMHRHVHVNAPAYAHAPAYAYSHEHEKPHCVTHQSKMRKPNLHCDENEKYMSQGIPNL
jgi:hypothetical protein